MEFPWLNGQRIIKSKSLKEFGCNLNNCNPYEHSDLPEFRDEVEHSCVLIFRNQ